MSWFVGSMDTSELCIYYTALCDFGGLDIKGQKIPSSPVSYCIKTNMYINTGTMNFV